ncbi:MAG: hypothetical protein QXU39_01560 [Candidatus Pacearchaeota archaeon]
MKSSTLVLTLVLFISIFATTFVVADEITEVSQLESIEATNSEIQEVTNEVAKQTQNFRKVGFIEIWRGNGWITNEENGYLIHGFWINQAYIKNGETDIKHLTFGKLKIAKLGNYKLVKKNETNITDSVEFYLIPLGKKLNEETAGKNPVGTLSLNKDKERNDLITWNGTLKLNLSGSQVIYDVKLGTIRKTIKPGFAKADAENIRGQKQAGKISLGKKMRFWGGN